MRRVSAGRRPWRGATRLSTARRRPALRGRQRGESAGSLLDSEGPWNHRALASQPVRSDANSRRRDTGSSKAGGGGCLRRARRPARASGRGAPAEEPAQRFGAPREVAASVSNTGSGVVLCWPISTTPNGTAVVPSPHGWDEEAQRRHDRRTRRSGTRRTSPRNGSALGVVGTAGSAPAGQPAADGPGGRRGGGGERGEGCDEPRRLG